MNIFLFCLLNAFNAAFNASAHSDLGKSIDSPQCQEWVDSVYNSLTEQERVAQLFIAHVNPESKDNVAYVVNRGIGGLLYTKGSLKSFASMTNYAQSIAKTPLLITLDGEWGIAMRVPEAPEFPRNMSLGAINEEKLLYEYGKEMARECQALGIQVNFAPVMDVNSNPDNPVIGYRSFGEDPKRVAKLGVAYSLGLESGGVMAVAKHFPGHGDTKDDSHKSLPRVERSLDSVKSIDLYPFKKFINSGCNGVMVGHIAVPALDSSLTPASMSPVIIGKKLKKDMGFDGLVFTDGLGMKGADMNENVCVAALKAGNDILLAPRNYANDLVAVMKAIENGEISRERIEKSVKKMLSYKYLLGLNNLRTVDEGHIGEILNSIDAESVNRRLCDAMITAVHNHDSILPLGNLGKNRIAVVNIGGHNDNEFDKMCSRYANVDIFNGSSASIEKLREYDVVIAAIFKANHSSQSILEAMKGLKGLVAVFMVNPYEMAKFKSALGNEAALVIAYESSPLAQQSAAKALFGGIKVDGKLPVNVSGVAEMGAGVELPKTRLGFATLKDANLKPNLSERIDSAIYACLKSGAFPGAQVLVAKGGDIVLNKNYGRTTNGGNPVTESTIYDLASVSKTVGTLPGIMKAYDLGLFDMDTPASNIIPGLNVSGKEDITPRMLLFHETGMPPSLNMFYLMMDTATYKGKLLSPKKDKEHSIKIEKKLYGHNDAKLRADLVSHKRTKNMAVPAAKDLYVGAATYDTIMSRIYKADLRKNRDYCYSCLNFCLLMDMEQRLTQQPHQKWVADSVWNPIGAYSFSYRPAEKYPDERIAATEKDNYLRRQHLRGYVHDELAAFSGGVQGNAGVFGSALDIAKLCQTWLNGGRYGDTQIFSESTNELFTTTKSPNSRRGLGFDKPDTENPENSPTCDEAGKNVYGHTGYTGTVFWVDPDQELIFVFLNNRVDPTRNNDAWNKSMVRTTLMRLIYESIEN